MILISQYLFIILRSFSIPLFTFDAFNLIIADYFKSYYLGNYVLEHVIYMNSLNCI
jgi:hypothetical protein